MATVQEQFDAFMKTRNSKKPHVGLLVEGFKREKNQISFQHEGKQISVPLNKVLYPRKQHIKPEDFIDFQQGIMLMFISGATINSLTTFPILNTTPVCTCTITCNLGSITIPTPPNINIGNLYFLPDFILPAPVILNDNALG
jgi:hypothetical protein